MPKGLPGLKGGGHIGFTVPNLEKALAFLSMLLAVKSCTKLDLLCPTITASRIS